MTRTLARAMVTSRRARSRSVCRSSIVSTSRCRTSLDARSASEGRGSIRANVGVELKGVRRSCEAPRAGIETVG
eukprot:31495-Pelagococcus_subviridis.AAC.12